jgi:DNA-binding CsgD family transcriptional regulator
VVTLPLINPMVSPIIVGRDHVLSSLTAAVDDVIAGRGWTVLLAGEAGLGKSRLVAETVAIAEQRGALVLTGQSFQPDYALPYAPFVDLLLSFARRSPDIATWPLTTVAPDLIAHMPELLTAIPGVVAAPSLGVEGDKRRLVAALKRLVTDLAERQPVLIVLEDIHWSDEASLETFLQLTRLSASGVPILLIATFRDNEVGEQLASVLSVLNRERMTTEITLSPLTHADVDSMVAAIGDRYGRLAEGTRATLRQLAEGNPFAVEELLRSAYLTREQQGDLTPETTIPLPRGVAESVRRRVELLSDDTRQTLVVAAVAGRRFDFALLEAVVGCDEFELLGQIKELIAAQLVVEASADQFVFRHALTREAIYSDLLTRERRAIHRKIATALQSLQRDDHDHAITNLAHHWYFAEQWDEAYRTSRLAGERALALYEPRLAVEHLTRALEATRHLRHDAPPTIYRLRGDAYATLGQHDAANADYELARANARANGDQGEEREALLALGALWASHDYERTGAYFRAALDLARQSDDPIALGRSLNRVGNWYANVAQPHEAISYHEEALSLFEQHDDRPDVARTLDLIGMAHYLGADMAASAAAFRRAIALSREVTDPQTLVGSLTMLPLTGGGASDHTIITTNEDVGRARYLIDEAVTIAQQIEWRAGEVFALNSGTILLTHQYPGAAMAMIEQATQIAEEIGHRQWLAYAASARGFLRAAMLDRNEAIRQFEIALDHAEAIGSRFWIPLISAELGLNVLETGDLHRVERVLNKAIAPNASMQTFGERQVWFARAALTLTQKNPARALQIADQLVESAIGRTADSDARLPHISQLRGRALAALGRHDEAMSALRAARAGAEARSILPLIWKIQAEIAAVARKQGHREEADQALIAAWSTIETFAAEITNDDDRATFLRNAVATVPRARRLTARRVARQAFGGLTERERAVATAVVSGGSNKEIAAQLFMSERTAATHISNILSKLDLKSRAQIAVWAKEHGLEGRGDQE